MAPVATIIVNFFSLEGNGQELSGTGWWMSGTH